MGSLQDLLQAEGDGKVVPVSYVKDLVEIAGYDAAMDIIDRFSPEQIIAGEEMLDGFAFEDEITSKQKLDRVVKFLELDSQFDRFNFRSEYHSIADGFDGFVSLHHKLLERDDKRLIDYSFFRNSFVNTLGDLIHKYGSEDLEQEGHRGKESKDASLKVLPGISTDELIEFMATHRVSSLGVETGFDNARAALEAASKLGYDVAREYVQLGLTSLEDVTSVDPATVKSLDKFNFRGDLNSGTFHRLNFDRFVVNYIRGNPNPPDDPHPGRRERLNRIAALAQHSDSGDYLFAFDGSVRQTEEIYAMPEDKRPSPQSIRYAKSVLGVRNVITTAREIDSPALALLNTLNFGDRVKMSFESDAPQTVEGVLAVFEDYNNVNNAYKEATGSKSNLSIQSYEAVKNFDGDLRFLADYSPDNSYAMGAAQKVSGAMDFETYDGLNIAPDKKAWLVGNLVERGHSAEEITDAFEYDTVNVHDVESMLRECNGTQVSLFAMGAISAAGVDASYGIEMVGSVSFDDNHIPYGALSGLESNDISPQQFSSFGDAVGFGKYKSDDGFDTMGMLQDLRLFCNKPEPLE